MRIFAIAVALACAGLAQAALPNDLAPISAPSPKGAADKTPPTATSSGIPIDAPWKNKLYEFAKQNVKHPAWGLPHSERDYLNALAIAKADHIPMDLDVLFAAAFLHDLGGLPPYEVEGVDHGARSAELAGPLLESWGFPMEKLPQVKEMIIGHVYYGPPPHNPQAIAFRDADILDFLGDMGIARILAVTEEKGFTPTLSSAIAMLKKMAVDLPPKLISPAAQAQAPARVAEMDRFFDSMRGYSFGGSAL